MFVNKNQSRIEVPLAEGTVFTVQGAAALTKKIHIENLDQVNTMTYKFQYSDDNVTWTDVAIATTLAPTATVHTDLTGHIFHRLRASGDLDIAVEASAFLAFNNLFNFAML